MTDPERPRPEDARVSEAELEAFLARRGSFGQRWREQSQEQAPPELDSAVLAYAEREARTPVGARRRRRWGAPLAIAATLLLVLGAIRYGLLPQPGEVPQARVQESAASAAAPAKKALAETAAPSALPAPALAAPAPNADELRAPREEPAVPAPPPAARRKAVAPEAKLEKEASPTTPAAPAMDAAAARSDAPSPFADYGAAAAAAQPPATSNAAPAGAVAPDSKPRPAPLQSRAAPMASGTLAERRADACANAAEKDASAEQSLAAVRELRDQGKRDAAKSELRCLRQREPQLAVPDDLRELGP